MKIQLSLYHRENWTSYKSTHVRGHAYNDGSLLSSTELAKDINSLKYLDDIQKYLEQLNGFYAVVKKENERIVAAVDHIGSKPLYYHCNQNKVHVSDNPVQIEKECEDNRYDRLAATEYLLSGYVSGRDTLNNNINQLQSGEILSIKTHSSRPKIDAANHYSFSIGHGTKDRPRNLLAITENSIQRLIDYADGRPILLGLSQGYDSRLIALMLYERGYENVITYTHDRRSNYDVDEISAAKSIARDLDFEHLSVNLTHQDFQNFYQSDSFKKFIESVGYVGSLPNIGAGVTLKKLKEEHQVPKNSVNVNGNIPVGVGSLLPQSWSNRDIIKKHEYVDEVYNSNYYRWKFPEIFKTNEMEAYVRNQILKKSSSEAFHKGKLESVTDAVHGMGSWYWQERSSKFLILNYENDYFGFDSWYPLWDRQYADFWETVDFRSIIGKEMHKNTVIKLDKKVRGRKISSKTRLAAQNGSKSFLNSVHDTLPDLIKPVVKDLYYNYYRQKYPDQYIDDPRYGLLSKKQFQKFNLRRSNPKRSNWVAFHIAVLYSDGFISLDSHPLLDQAVPK